MREYTQAVITDIASNWAEINRIDVLSTENIDDIDECFHDHFAYLMAIVHADIQRLENRIAPRVLVGNLARIPKSAVHDQLPNIRLWL